MRPRASVENLVCFVKGSFFKERRFQDQEDVVCQLADWHREVNTVRPCRATGATPQARIALDREHLRHLAIPPTVRRLYPDLETRVEAEGLSHRDYLALLLA